MSMRKTVYLGIDPGSHNMGIVGLDQTGNITCCWMLRNRIESTAQKNAEMRRRFRITMRNILRRLSPHEVLSEEFMIRGFGTHQIELVALMLGSIQAICDEVGAKEFMVMPSSWKRAYCKQVKNKDGLVKAYAKARTKGVPPHIVDALALATYLQLGQKFDGLNNVQFFKNIRAAAKMLPAEMKIKPKKNK